MIKQYWIIAICLTLTFIVEVTAEESFVPTTGNSIVLTQQDRILILAPHPDDEILGVGGTIAKYSKEGKNNYVVIFSYGEVSHLKEEIIKLKSV